MVVKTRWERPERRRFLTVTAPLFVELGSGSRQRAAEWSLGGLSITDSNDPVPQVGTVETLKLTLPFQGFDISFLVTGNIIESDPPHGSFAAEFVQLGDRERGLLCHFLDELVRGSMTPVEDTIQRIDVPVSPLQLEPQSLSDGAGSQLGKAANAGVMTAIYALLGMVVFGYLGLLFYSNLMRFEIDSARLTVPSDRVLALGEGHVRRTDLRPGDAVSRGDVLAYVYDNQLEREIELADIGVRESEAKVGHLKRQATGDVQRASPNGQRTRLELDSITARVQAAEHEVKRLASLPRFAQNVLKLEEARKKLIAYQKTLESRQIDLSPVEALAYQAGQELEFTRQRHSALVGHRDRLAVRAPFDGVLVELPRGDNSSVRKGDVVAVVEQSSVPKVTALLSTHDVMRIGIGEPARLYMPTASTFMNARITKIDQVADLIASGERSAAVGPNAHGANANWSRIELQVDEPKLLGDRALYHSGMPVVVQFQRRWAHALVTGFSRRVNETIAAVRVRVGNGAHASARQ